MTHARAFLTLPLPRVTQDAWRVVHATLVETSLALLTIEVVVRVRRIVAAAPLALVAGSTCNVVALLHLTVVFEPSTTRKVMAWIERARYAIALRV